MGQAHKAKQKGFFLHHSEWVEQLIGHYDFI